MRRRSVFCAGCAHLFCIGGGALLCVATAKFKAGPLRKRIDVVDVVSAEIRNIKNDCVHRANVSLRAWELKRWLLWRLNDGDTIRPEDRIEENDLSNYPVEKEYERKREILERKQGRDRQEDKSGGYEETFEAAREEESRESIFNDGGIDDNDGDSPSDQSIGEVVQDPGDTGGLGGEYVPQDESGTDD